MTIGKIFNNTNMQHILIIIFAYSINFTFSHKLFWHKCGEYHVNLFLIFKNSTMHS